MTTAIFMDSPFEPFVGLNSPSNQRRATARPDNPTTAQLLFPNQFLCLDHWG
jgi:hypothetical protein